MCSVFTIVLYSMTISSKTLTNVFILLGIVKKEHSMMIKIAMPMMMTITEIEKRPL